MSRSFKKFPGLVDRNPGSKKQANKAVRSSDCSDYSAYKKEYNSYNICDYAFVHYPAGKKNISRKAGIPDESELRLKGKCPTDKDIRKATTK
jgi:hypothetical protein